MSSPEASVSEETFGQHLEEMRIQIDALPADKRPHLYAMADEVQRQHAQMLKTCADAGQTANHLRRIANSKKKTPA